MVCLVIPEVGNGPGAIVVTSLSPRLPLLEGARPWAPPAPPPLAPRARLAAALRACQGLARPAPAALAAGDWAGAAGALAGLGPGLTPAGDDVLAGCCVALHRAGHRFATAFGAQLSSVPAEATTPLSHHLLKWAARGVAGEKHLAWLDALLVGRPADPAPVLACGATSGADWIAGALAALEHFVLV